MIDYLERLFAPEQDLREGEEEKFPSSFLHTQEPVQDMPMPGFREEAVQNMTVPGVREESVQNMPVSRFPEEAAEQQWKRRLESELAVQEDQIIRLPSELGEGLKRITLNREEPAFEEYFPRNLQRNRDGAQGEELEHRLRRNSRRYDSGFFLY